MRFERIRSGEEPRYGEAMALYQRSFPLFEQRYPQVQLAVTQAVAQFTGLSTDHISVLRKQPDPQSK